MYHIIKGKQLFKTLILDLTQLPPLIIKFIMDIFLFFVSEFLIIFSLHLVDRGMHISVVLCKCVFCV